MKISSLLFGLLLLNYYADAQVLMGNAGAHHSNPTSQLQWSLGESIIGSSGNNNYFLSIGYQQPIKVEIVGLEDTELLAGIRLYPNPILEHVYLELTEKISKNYILTINQINGKTLDVKVEYEDERVKIDAAKWASGVYLLRIFHNGRVFVAKIVKP